MPVVKFIAPFASVSGRIAGDPVGSKGGGTLPPGVVCMPQPNGTCNLRAMVTPNQPNTPQQLAFRAQMASISEAFQSLTLAQVQQWKSLSSYITNSGRFGDDYKPNWNNVFTQVNSLRLQNGLTIVYDAPDFEFTPLLAFPAFPLDVVNSDDGTPDQALNVFLEFGNSVPAEAGVIYRLRLTRRSSSPIQQIPDNELRYITADTEDSWFTTPATATFSAAITATRLNIFVGDYVGVELFVVGPGYVPSQRLYLPNTQVQSV